MVHGFASLSLDGLASRSTAQERAARLEGLLDFAVAGICRAPRLAEFKGP